MVTFLVPCNGVHVSHCRNSLSHKETYRATGVTKSTDRATGVTKSTVEVMVAAAAAAAASSKVTSSELSGSPTKRSAGTLYSDDIVVEGAPNGGSSPNKERDLRHQLLSKQKRKSLMARLGWQRKS